MLFSKSNRIKLKMKPKIKAVFFDAGGTLFKPYPSVGEIYAKAAASFGVECDPIKLEEAFYLFWKKRGGLASLGAETSEEKERMWWYTLVEEVFSRHGGIPEFEKFFHGLHRSFEEKELWEIFPEVPEVLRELRGRKIVLGVVSNWDLRLAKLLVNLGLRSHFDFFVSSSLCGATKPEAKIFKEALALAKVKPEEALHVGDTYEEDFVGAKAVGINVLLLDRNQNGQTVPKELSIGSLKEILKRI